TDDRRQRRPDLMAHVCQERGLQPGHFFGAVPGFDQAVFVFLPFGGVSYDGLGDVFVGEPYTDLDGERGAVLAPEQLFEADGAFIGTGIPIEPGRLLVGGGEEVFEADPFEFVARVAGHFAGARVCFDEASAPGRGEDAVGGLFDEVSVPVLAEAKGHLGLSLLCDVEYRTDNGGPALIFDHRSDHLDLDDLAILSQAAYAVVLRHELVLEPIPDVPA